MQSTASKEFDREWPRPWATASPSPASTHQDGDPWEYMTVAPVRMVLTDSWTVQDPIVVAAVPYNTGIGAVEWIDELIGL